MDEMPARSKRNTYVVESSLNKQYLKGGMAVASYHFDELMMWTY